MAGSLDAPELLGVDVQQIPRLGVLIALHRLARLQIREPAQPRAAQHSADRRLRHTDAAGNSRLDHATLPQLDDEQCFARIDRPRRAPGPRRRVGQSVSSFGQVAPQPFAGRARRHPMAQRRLRRLESPLRHLLNHLQATGEGKSGILMGVHPAAPGSAACLATPSLPDAVRVNHRYNLLKLHS